jgi:hypothetical protein
MIPTSTVWLADSTLEISPPAISSFDRFGLSDPWPLGEPFPDE